MAYFGKQGTYLINYNLYCGMIITCYYILEKRQLCENFIKGRCNTNQCDLLHTYKYCFSYQNTTCHNSTCLYLHITSVEQARYERTGKASDRMRTEVGRTLQNTNICGDYKSGRCQRENCNRRHIAHTEKMECIICCQEVSRDTFGAGRCKHVYCYTCALKCADYIQTEDILTIECPININIRLI
ncbi:hypothetical protein PUN28_015279 [Cardiocondyla obscurior]|uniref:Uncharacterized protein n=1 Tax=Cardiocondyla obscurior TaxID=286306 RepID=A0AAW2F1S3_9HYME